MKKIFAVIIPVIIEILSIILIALKVNGKLYKGTDVLATIEGSILAIDEKSILINETGYENGECYLIVDENTEYYIGNNKSNISCIGVGKTIMVLNSGGKEENYPGTSGGGRAMRWHRWPTTTKQVEI